MLLLWREMKMTAAEPKTYDLEDIEKMLLAVANVYAQRTGADYNLGCECAVLHLRRYFDRLMREGTGFMEPSSP